MDSLPHIFAILLFLCLYEDMDVTEPTAPPKGGVLEECHENQHKELKNIFVFSYRIGQVER